jgi:hypothetical protein
LKIPNTTGLVAIGMWVILLTLIVEPILTPFIAKRLRVAEPIEDTKKIDVGHTPVVILGTRGRSFIDRLPRVTAWAQAHACKRIMVLLCPEDKYNDEYVQTIAQEAQKAFESMPERKSIEYIFTSRRGFLQDNIEEIASTDSSVTAIFVGRKMLDFRLSEIKKLTVPIVFID